MPEVDAVIGTNELEPITALCEGVEPDAESVRRVSLSRPDAARSRNPEALRVHQNRRRLRSSLHLLRDPAVSRRISQPPFESVISEATRLFSQGVREINLIGQDTTCYGEDFGLKDGLATLLARLAQIDTAAG